MRANERSERPSGPFKTRLSRLETDPMNCCIYLSIGPLVCPSIHSLLLRLFTALMGISLYNAPVQIVPARAAHDRGSRVYSLVFGFYFLSLKCASSLSTSLLCEERDSKQNFLKTFPEFPY